MCLVIALNRYEFIFAHFVLHSNDRHHYDAMRSHSGTAVLYDALYYLAGKQAVTVVLRLKLRLTTTKEVRRTAELLPLIFLHPFPPLDFNKIVHASFYAST